MEPPQFVPSGWLRNRHLQTLYGALLVPAPHVTFRRERWDTPDGDFVDVDFVDGPEDAPWVHLFHGLEGSADSTYSRTLMSLVHQHKWRGSVFHFRGCSGEPNRLPRAYHSGDSEEIGWALHRVKSRAGNKPLYVCGISLGGNALAKWLGLEGEAAVPVVARAAVISAPLDLMSAGEALGQGFAMVYTRHFLKTLKKASLKKLERFPGMYDAEKVANARNLREFDDLVTAPLHGFRDTDDYWTRASAKPHLSAIRVPTLVLNALDDPFLPAAALPTEREVSPAVKLEFPPHGGHVGFVSGPFPGNVRWLPQRVLHYFEHLS